MVPVKSSVVVHADGISASDLHLILTNAVAPASEEIEFSIRHFRSAETAILVAVVGALGTGLGALVTGIMRVAAERGKSTIVLQGRSGWRVEIPADCSADKLAEYVEIARGNDVRRINF